MKPPLAFVASKTLLSRRHLISARQTLFGAENFIAVMQSTYPNCKNYSEFESYKVFDGLNKSIHFFLPGVAGRPGGLSPLNHHCHSAICQSAFPCRFEFSEVSADTESQRNISQHPISPRCEICSRGYKPTRDHPHQWLRKFSVTIQPLNSRK